jgi:hypothetical protein
MNEKLQAEFARLLPAVDNPPSDNTAALGHLMRQWLLGTIADAGTGVDTGGGLGCYDLWVKVGGEEIFISLRSRAGRVIPVSPEGGG